jgi:hypothetical protein
MPSWWLKAASPAAIPPNRFNRELWPTGRSLTFVIYLNLKSRPCVKSDSSWTTSVALPGLDDFFSTQGHPPAQTFLTASGLRFGHANQRHIDSDEHIASHQDETLQHGEHLRTGTITATPLQPIISANRLTPFCWCPSSLCPVWCSRLLKVGGRTITSKLAPQLQHISASTFKYTNNHTYPCGTPPLDSSMATRAVPPD